MDDKQARDYALFLHLSSLSWILGIPGFIGPLVMWLIKKDESTFVDAHGKAAVNFQISLVIYVVALAILAVVFIIGTLGIGALLVIPLIIVLAIAFFVLSILFPILAAVAASKGEAYRYPLAIEFIK